MGALDFLSDPTNLISILLSLLVVVFVGWRMNKTISEEGLTLTQYFNEKIIGQHMGIVLLFIFLSALAESIIASTIPHPKEFMNPVGRFIAHFSMNIVGVVLLITVPTEIMELITSIKKANKSLVFVRLIKVSLTSYAAFIIPYWNFNIIAQGLHQLHLAKYAFRELIGIDMTSFYVSQGLGPDFSAFDHISNQLYASLMLVVIHYILATVDGTHAMIALLEGKTTKPQTLKSSPKIVKEKKKKKKKIEVRDPSYPSLEVFIDLIEFVNPNLHQDSVEEIAQEALDNITDTELYSTELIKISTRTKSLYDELLAIEGASPQQEFRLRKRIRDFFRKSPSKGGVGRPIPQTAQEL